MERLKVLVADGSTFMRIMLQNTLETLGFDVCATAKDGKECLDRCVETKPDIVLVDMALDGLDYASLVSTISQENPAVNVIMTVPEGLDDPDVIVAAVRAGIKGYIKKPLSAEDLRARFQRILRKEE